MQVQERNSIEIQKPRSSEIYRYLGLLALIKEAEPTNEYLGQQIATELAESLNAEMGTHGKPISLDVVDKHLIDPSGHSMTSSAQSWSKAQQLRTSNDPNLVWFARFAEIEAEEHVAVAEFASEAKDGDSVMVISPFPEEAYANPDTNHTVQHEGFRPSIKRAFIRVYEKQGDEILEHVQSIDSSALATWNDVLISMGMPPVATTEQLLAKRTTHSGIGGQELIERTALLYDEILARKTNMRYSFGKELGGGLEANAFVWSHPNIIADTIAELSEIAHLDNEQAETLARGALYNSKALINSLYEQSLQGVKTQDLSQQEIRGMRAAEGASAAAEGKSYDGCAPSGASTSTEATQVNALHIKSTTMRNGLEIHDCIKCPACTRIVAAIRDPKSGTWACPRSDCKGYNAKMSAKLEKGSGYSQGDTKDFGDLLVEFFFGNKKSETSKLPKN